MTVRTSTWRAVAVLVAIQTALVLLAIAGLARAEERVSPTLAILLSAPRHYTDAEEPADERRERLTEIAEAIDRATSRRSERALLLAVGWHESRWSSAVCSGEKTGDEGRAFGCWQSWQEDRSGGIPGQVHRALTHLRRAARWCKGTGEERVRRAVSLYGTGNNCSWVGANKRVRTWRAYVERMR